jgi:hypothetical protein
VGRIRNNILEGGRGATRFGVYEDSPVGKTCEFEKLESNDFAIAATSASDVLYRSWNGAFGANVTTIAAVNTLNPGNASNNLQANPDIDPATFHLMAGSPCIDTGTATEAPAKDFDGQTRPRGAGYDIGPDEF